MRKVVLERRVFYHNFRVNGRTYVELGTAYTVVQVEERDAEHLHRSQYMTRHFLKLLRVDKGDTLYKHVPRKAT